MSVISIVCWSVAHHFSLLETRHLLPAIVMTINIESSLVYAGTGDWGRFTYWFAAGVITFAVTFMMGR